MGYILVVLFIGFKILEGFIFVGLVELVYGSVLLQALVIAGLVIETMIIFDICVELQKVKKLISNNRRDPSASGAIGIFWEVDKTQPRK